MRLKLDSWQEEVLKTKGNICLRSGRQVGKSTVIGIKAAQFALDNPNKLIMIISKTDRQANLLFSKVLFNLHEIDRNQIMKGRDKKTKQLLSPTKHLINLKNGSKIYSLPAGDTGFGIMGFTIDLLIADEAAFIPEEVWNSIVPALAITRGEIWLLSTPFLMKGYYYKCFNDESFTQFHTSSEDCPRRDDVFLANRKANLTKAQYAQMYLGEFVDEILKFFPEELVMKCCVLKRRKSIKQHNRDYFIGCDVGRMADKFTYEILDGTNKEAVEQVENLWVIDKPIPEATRRIIDLNSQYDFNMKGILIDSGGMGITVCDILREDDECKGKVVEINNASRPYDRDEKQKKILKDDLYANLKKMMEQGKIKLLDDENVKESLRCIQRDFSEETGKAKITGTESHIVEGLIRAAHGIKCKGLNLFVA